VQCDCGLVDILELKDRIVLLYDGAQLDGDNSELDALKRLASSHISNSALLNYSDETLPALPYSSQHPTSKQSRKNSPKNTVVTSSVSTAAAKNTVPPSSISSAAERTVKVERVSAEHPTCAKRAKLLLIPNTTTLITKHQSVTEHSHSRAVQGVSGNGELPGSEQGMLALTKRKNVSERGQKSVPLCDVMNVKLTSARSDRQGLVSLVPLSTVASVPSAQTKVEPEWNQHVKIKREPGTSGKRKWPEEPGML